MLFFIGGAITLHRGGGGGGVGAAVGRIHGTGARQHSVPAVDRTGLRWHTATEGKVLGLHACRWDASAPVALGHCGSGGTVLNWTQWAKRLHAQARLG